MRWRQKTSGEGGSLAQLYPRGFWQGASAPGVVWLILLFVVPVYAIVSTAGGSLDPATGLAVPTWNPAEWDRVSWRYVLDNAFANDGVYRALFVRTFVYVLSAVTLSLVIGYPVAYHVSRLRGRRRGLMLALLIVPFWISYLMRMLAWVGLLEDDGIVNRILGFVGIDPYPWLGGSGITVVFGLAYGYVPFLILPLFAALDRIPDSTLEAAWDLGASAFGTFRRVILPMSKNGVLAGVAIVMLPMFGDFYTAYLLSKGRPETAMIGNAIQDLLQNSTFAYAQARGAALVTLLAAVVSILTLYYIFATAKATREVRR
jgi:spermidine/putrescine transport system permease protein